MRMEGSFGRFDIDIFKSSIDDALSKKRIAPTKAISNKIKPSVSFFLSFILSLYTAAHNIAHECIDNLPCLGRPGTLPLGHCLRHRELAPDTYEP